MASSNLRELQNFMTLFIFIVTILVLLSVDLLFNGNNKANTLKKSAFLSVMYIAISLLFAWYLYTWDSHKNAEFFLTGYLVEKSLSLDNIFVIALIFKHYHIAENNQKRLLIYGVFGALVMRAILIYLGASIISQFEWILHILSLFLIFTGIKLLFKKDNNEKISEHALLKKMLSKIIAIKTDQNNPHFFVRLNDIDMKSSKALIKKYAATSAFLALCIIELSDLIFALDSIPAIFSITTDPFLVYTSNIFAILGLRSLYFIIHEILKKFKYIHYSLACLLIFIGSKGIIKEVFSIEKIDSKITLLITLCILILGMIPFNNTKSQIKGDKA
ncbi:MAG: Putative membrane-bound redox modulator Alx [Holosporales bacterium]